MATGRIFTGYGVDGTALYATVTLAPHKQICCDCDGDGTVVYDDGVDGFSRLSKDTCERCDGTGEITIDEVEDEQ